MGSFLPFRRRRREQGAEHRSDGPPSLPSSRTYTVPSPAPTHHTYAYPNSLGYADTASLHSTYSLPWSPISSTPSPTPIPCDHPNKSTPGLWIYDSDRSNAREELEAARQRSRLNAYQNPIVSYGPNPVTPTPARISTPSPSYLNGSSRPDPQPTPPPPQRSPGPTIISYGPNRITPTPPIANVTVPPEDAIINRQRAACSNANSNSNSTASLTPNPNRDPSPSPSFLSHPQDGHLSFDRRQSISPSQEAESPTLPSFPPPSVPMGPEPSSLSSSRSCRPSVSASARAHSVSREPDQTKKEEPEPIIAPLPPYASPEEYEAMSRGAVRTLELPREVQAELPPTKDGYYHFLAPVALQQTGTGQEEEFELEGGWGPGKEPLFPFRPWEAGRRGRMGMGSEDVWMEEQKVLLDDVGRALKEGIVKRVEGKGVEEEEEKEREPPWELMEPSFVVLMS